MKVQWIIAPALLVQLSCSDGKFHGAASTSQLPKAGDAVPAVPEAPGEDAVPAPMVPAPENIVAEDPVIPVVENPVVEIVSEEGMLPQPGPEVVRKTAPYDIQTVLPPLDIVLTVDNSGTMDQEAAIVRANLDKFINDISSRADVRLNLISSKRRNPVVLTPAQIALGHLQAGPEVEVGSYNLFALAASALCPVAESDLPHPFPQTGGKVCNVAFPGTLQKDGRYSNGLDQQVGVQEIRGQFADRIRPNSRIVFIWVTDDGAGGAIKSNNFLEATKLKSRAVTNYSFTFSGAKRTITRADGSSYLCEGGNGTQYSNFAKSTGGQDFDICAEDWSPHFSTISRNETELANKVFKVVSDKEITIMMVLVDDVALKPEQVKIDGKEVVLLDESLGKTGGKLKIIYDEVQ